MKNGKILITVYNSFICTWKIKNVIKTYIYLFFSDNYYWHYLLNCLSIKFSNKSMYGIKITENQLLHPDPRTQSINVSNVMSKKLLF